MLKDAEERSFEMGARRRICAREELWRGRTSASAQTHDVKNLPNTTTSPLLLTTKERKQIMIGGIKELLPFLSLLILVLGKTSAFHFPSSLLTTSRKICRHRLQMTYYPSPTETEKEIYNIPNSGWKSKQWNWGSASGTGHDAAMICRRRWDSREERQKLVQSLLDPVEFKASYPDSEVPFEEVKLVLGLAWQRGRWDGSDGGPGGYGE
eukprot:scaffold21033_cov71-Skeletonema_dohrnii-CCMP3373.AAC.1